MYYAQLFTIFALLSSSTQAANLVIAAVGASITYGYHSSHGNGYRDDMTNALEAAGHKVHMVGTVMSGDTTWRMSEGWPGYTVDEVSDKFISNYKNFQIDRGTLQTPNVIVTLVGTNDNNPYGTNITPTTVAAAPDRFNTLLTTYQTTCPDCVIIASSLPPNSDVTWNANIVGYNTAIKKIIDQRTAAGQHILFNDANSGLTVAHDMGPDGTHPNDGGYATIGQRFAAQIEAAVAKGWTKTPENFEVV